MLKGKICLVTGTSKGIGKKIVELFVENGATVYAGARENGCLDAWANEFNSNSSGNIVPVYFDMTSSQEIKEAVARIKKEAGQLDVLVNNAGMVTNELFGLVSMDKMRQMFEVNVFGLFELSQMVVSKLMLRQGYGCIVNITSIVAVKGQSGQVAYSASKGAIISMTKSLAKELSSKGIRVNAVAPGMIATERILDTIDDKYKGNIPQIGFGRLGKPDEVAQACLFLASDNSNYITGQILSVDGDIKI